MKNKITLILLAGLALGSSTVMTRLGVTEFPPLTLVALRLALSSTFFALSLVFLRRKLALDRRTSLSLFIGGMLNSAFPLLVWTFSLQYISSGVLTIFFTLIPLFTGLLAHLLLDQERLSRRRFAGLIVALIGALLLVVTGTSGLSGAQPTQGSIQTDSAALINYNLPIAQQTSTEPWRGHLLAFAGVVSAASGLIYTRRRLQRRDPWVVAAGQAVASVLVLAPLAVVLADFVPSTITWKGWTALGYSSLVGSFLGFLLLFRILKQFGASDASLPGYVVPLVSTFLGALLLGEIVTLPLVSGAVLVLLGVFWASRK